MSDDIADLDKRLLETALTLSAERFEEIKRLNTALAEAREVVGDLVHLAWITGPLARTQSDFKKLPQIEKAGAFLGRSGAETKGEP